MPIRLIVEKEINGESAEKSASAKILKHISEVVGKSMKTENRIFTDKEIDSLLEFKKLYTIQIFAELQVLSFMNVNSKIVKSFKSILKSGGRNCKLKSY